MTQGNDSSEQADIRSVVRDGFVRSLASLLIKVATAGLTYLMFVVLSRSMGGVEYGQFAFGFALATVLAIAASMGQQTAILRYWPEETGKGNQTRALNALKSGWALTLMAGVVLTLVVCVGAVGFGLIGPGLSGVLHIAAASLLILPMGAAEYGSSALRAQGSVWTALLPRDIVWRLAVVLGALALLLSGTRIGGPAALALTALLLALAMLVQFIVARWRGYANGMGFRQLPDYWQAHGGASRWFFIGTVVDSAALNVDVVLVGLFVAAESAGLYFNAFRTAGLMTLFMFAITLVIAPMVARHYHAGDLRKAQAVTTLCAWAGFVFSVIVFIGYVFFGDLVLSLFGETYADGQWLLILLSLGLLADAATGPTRIVMMMTGFERQYVKIFGLIMLVGFVLQLLVIPLFGIIAAAAVNAGVRIVAQTAIAVWTRKHVGIDTSLVGIFALKQPIEPI